MKNTKAPSTKTKISTKILSAKLNEPTIQATSSANQSVCLTQQSNTDGNNGGPPNSAQIQKLLDENLGLINTIQEYQNLVCSLRRFENRYACIWVHEETIIHLKYSDILTASKDLSDALQSIYVLQATTYVGLLFDHSTILVPAILSIVDCKGTFCFVSPQDSIGSILQALCDFNVNIVLSEKCFFERYPNDFKLIGELTVLGHQITALEMKDFLPIHHRQKEIMFAGRTSGSTGQPKIIHVPYTCFWPNIESIRNRVTCTENDVIFVSAPPTFDPFLVDIFLALTTGAAIVMTSNVIRLSPRRLLSMLITLSPTVTQIQMTPSLFCRWSPEQIRQVISLPLRVLILGGEPFPYIGMVAEWLDWHRSNSATFRLFNIYGLTEISCWSTMCEITADDVNRLAEIPIGTPLDDDTELIVSNANENGIGELCIVNKTRFTYRDELVDYTSGPKQISIIETKDLVKSLDGCSSYAFCGRSDSKVKRFGKLIDLERIRQLAITEPHVRNAYCHYDDATKSILLAVAVGGNAHPSVCTEKSLRSFLHSCLSKFECPDKIVVLPGQLPLSAHGKVMIGDLLASHRNKLICMKRSTNGAGEFFIAKLNYAFGLTLSVKMQRDPKAVSLKKQKTDLDRSFVDVGGTSMMAMQISSEIDRLFDRTYPLLIGHLLNETFSIWNVVRYLENADNIDDLKILSVTVEMATQMWKVDLTKCIDADPTIIRLADRTNIVSVGSHAHKLINVHINDGTILSLLELPDRIEGSVSVFNHCDDLLFGLVGCYNETLYCFDIRSGLIVWETNVGGKIKCKPLVCNGHAYFGNYNSRQNLWCVNILQGNVVWSKKIGEKSISADTIYFERDRSILVCTIDGTVAKISADTGQAFWSQKLPNPVFSTPAVILDDSLAANIVLVDVIGSVYCILESGSLIWQYDIPSKGNVFGAVRVQQHTALAHIYIASHDKNVYCIEYKFTESGGNLIWTFTGSAAFNASPIFMPEHWLLVVSINGHISIVDRNTGVLKYNLTVPGQVFGTPAFDVDSSCLIVGCRDNYLHAFRLHV